MPRKPKAPRLDTSQQIKIKAVYDWSRFQGLQTPIPQIGAFFGASAHQSYTAVSGRVSGCKKRSPAYPEPPRLEEQVSNITSTQVDPGAVMAAKRLPTADDFSKNITLSITPPPQNKPASNILLLLHGLGDTHASFTQLGTNLNLPETCCIALRAPKPLLDFGGSHWGDDIIFDNSPASGGLDPDGGFKESTILLKTVVQDVLVGKCGFAPRDVLLFGFGQGGMAALHAAATALNDGNSGGELGGVISIGAGLPSEAPAALVAKCKTPVLVCAGSASGGASAVTALTEEKLKRVFESVEIKRYRRPDDGMPRDRDEMMPIMQFLARRLRSTAGVPQGAVEVS